MKNKNLLLFTIGIFVTILVFYSISIITPEMALKYDANTYWTESGKIATWRGIIKHLISPDQNRFIDGGYLTFLGIGKIIFGDKVRTFQFFNYLFWFISAFLVYKSLAILNSEKSKLIYLLMISSPLYLTFSAKLYSEPYTCLGISLFIYGMTMVLYKDRNRLKNLLSIILGGYIFFTTKSVFLLLIIPLIIFFIIKNNSKAIISISILIFILTPNILSSFYGGRSHYNLAIQASKIEQKPLTIATCAIYHLSYPAGIAIAPEFQGACHQNDPSHDMPKSQKNPYLIASRRRDQDLSSTGKIIGYILKSPIRYFTAMLSSMFTIILFEGIYPTVLLTLPFSLIIPAYLIGKVFLSLFLWALFVKSIVNVAKNCNIKTALWLLIPLAYFFFIVGNFPVEQRYFYPLIPYVYFVAGLPNYQKKP